MAFGTDMSYADGGRFESVVAFQTRPEMVDVLVQDVTDGMAKMASEGPSAQELDEAKKYLVKHHAELQAARKNSVSAKNRECIDLVRYGVDMDAGYEAVMEGIDAGDIRKFAGNLQKEINLSKFIGKNRIIKTGSELCRKNPTSSKTGPVTSFSGACLQLS